MASAKTAYFPYIDGLRALAVLSVMLFHLNAHWLPGGFSGVDIFFVISGFVVSSSVANLGSVSIGRFLLLFYARRMRRILPALIVVLLVTGLVSALFIPSSYLSDKSQKTGLYAFFGLSNFILGSVGNDYFSPTAEFNPYTHTWSLGVEEQFYLAFPFLFWAWLARKNWRHLSVILIAAGLGASLVWGHWLGQANQTQAFYFIFGRFWELAAGVLLYQCFILSGFVTDESSRAPATVGTKIGAWVSLAIVMVGLVTSKSDHYPFPGAIIPVVGTVGLLGFLYRREHAGFISTVLESGPARFVGRISYSLYLWHWPIYVVLRWTAGLESVLTIVCAIVLTFALAMASYRFIEEPFRHGLSATRIPRLVIVGCGLCLMIGGAGLSSMMAEAQPKFSLSTVTRHGDDWYPYGTDTNPAFPGCHTDVAPQDVQGGQLWVYARKNCDLPAKSAHRIFVIGDSHAMAYSGMFKQFVVQTGVTVYAYNNAGCPFLSLQPWREDGNPVCHQYGDSALKDMLTKLQPGDVVFLPSLRLPRMIDQWAYFGDETARNQLFGDEAVKGRNRSVEEAIPILQEIERHGGKVVLEAPKPIFRMVPYRCSDWFNRHNPICERGPLIDRSEIDEMRAPILQSYAQMEAKVPNVYTWDPLPTLCSDRTCSAYDGKKPLFFDGDHISGYGNLRVLPSFESLMLKLL
ncbi:acyltransferase family protein [Burkholderia territorii]|uniref:Acyltransferase n=1 Tax=Burkholderia territorii TaxID=1503055 RepID=A0A6L3NMH1_9BURK|nr:acyltransferase family protein [Burkholderia territorii]KAB0685838.1 acyltransferase [Burkholderia territorii]MBM2773805.1 acyltransferase [Burkholderia territorii]VWB62425.1 O-antigen acetylase [Burkholderia territorii]